VLGGCDQLNGDRIGQIFHDEVLFADSLQPYDGDPLEVGDWARMVGDHFCGRPRNTASAISGTLHALGESLRLSPGPYNRRIGGQRLARGVIHSGVMQWVEQDGEEYQIQLRRTFELGPDHAIWLWYENQIEPEVVASSGWIQKDDTWLTSVPAGARPIAFAISFQSAWLGGPNHPVGMEGVGKRDQLFTGLADNSTMAKMVASSVASREPDSRCPRASCGVPNRNTVLVASAEDLQGDARYSEEHEDAWRSVTRSFLWDWKPDASESALILKRLGLFTGDPDRDSRQAWDGCEELLTIHPLLLALAARRG
jgi:hypothetical protein